jgi:hypothetical protein
MQIGGVRSAVDPGDDYLDVMILLLRVLDSHVEEAPVLENARVTELVFRTALPRSRFCCTRSS